MKAVTEKFLADNPSHPRRSAVEQDFNDARLALIQLSLDQPDPAFLSRLKELVESPETHAATKARFREALDAITNKKADATTPP